MVKKCEFKRWVHDSKGMYGVAICKHCGREYFVGDSEGCKRKTLNENDR